MCSKEFIGCKKFFKEKKIVFKIKVGRNKASVAEYAIFEIKRRLYKVLRGMLSQNWLKYIELVVKQYNESPKQKLGGLSPNMIHCEYDSVLVNEARKKKNLQVFEQPHFKEQIENQKKYERNSNQLQVGDYVYLSSDEKLFDKSFDTQV